MDLPEPPPEQRDRLVPEDARPAETAVWTGVVWARLGQGGHAWRWWDAAEDAAVRGWIEAERATLLRDLGLHAAAERRDRDALTIASDLVTIVRLRAGLLADAVARGDVPAINLRLEAAAALAGCLPPRPVASRLRLRIGLARAEATALCHEPLDDAVLPTISDDGITWPRAYAAVAADDRARGLLVAGRLREDDDLLTAAADHAPPAIAWQAHLARGERGASGAAAAARTLWRSLTPPPGYEQDHHRAGRRLGVTAGAGS